MPNYTIHPSKYDPNHHRPPGKELRVKITEELYTDVLAVMEAKRLSSISEVVRDSLRRWVSKNERFVEAREAGVKEDFTPRELLESNEPLKVLSREDIEQNAERVRLLMEQQKGPSIMEILKGGFKEDKKENLDIPPDEVMLPEEDEGTDV